MHISAPLSPLSIRRRWLGAGLFFAALLAGGSAQAQIVDFYVAETDAGTGASTLLEYNFDASAPTTASLVNTYALNGIVGVPATGASATDGSLQLSGDGTMLSYAGFNSSGKSTEVLFNLSSKAADGTTTDTAYTVRSNYTANGSGFYIGGASSATSPGLLGVGGTSATALNSAGAISVNTITANNGNLFYSRFSTGLGGVYMASGLPTGAGTWNLLTGTGWGNINTGASRDFVNGMSFLGTNTLFVADGTTNQIDVFTNGSPGTFSSWNLATGYLSLTLSGAEAIQQLSVQQIDAGDAIIFFTLNGTTPSGVNGGTSQLDEVSWNSSTGFGTVHTLASGGATDYFTGVAAVPEPSTYALLGLGLGLAGMVSFLRKAKREQA